MGYAYSDDLLTRLHKPGNFPEVGRAIMNLDELKDGIFHVWQPNSVDLLKSQPGDADDKWRIGGFASTEALDRQDESVLQRGLDFSEFIHFGYFNDNHQQHTAAVVGIPELAEFKKSGGWWTEGFLLKNVERATAIYNLAKSLMAEAPDRRLGFSIEGKILERIGNKIAKAIIRNVAITNSPVNVECTWGLITKSWADDLEAKALSVGHARYAPEGGKVLVPEDLEQDEVRYIYKCPICSKAFGSTVGLEEHMGSAHSTMPITRALYGSVIRRPARLLTKSEAVDYLKRLRPEYSEEVIVRLVEHALNQDDKGE